MQMRLAFAVAAHLDPEVLIVDEVLAVGDAAFQQKCLGKVGEVTKSGRTVLLVSHQLNQVRRLCNRVVWLDGGRVRQIGPTAEVVTAYEGALSLCGRKVTAGTMGPRRVS
jgi:ABC-type polysaccharide/polyol phosphate transport system ATPase subunit